MSAFLMPITQLAESQIKRGLQIVAIPDHIQDMYRDGKTGEVDSLVLNLVNYAGQYQVTGPQLGFVTSVAKDGCFCRYFYHPYLASDMVTLRTTANSELTYFRHLFVHDHKPQELIDALLEKYC